MNCYKQNAFGEGGQQEQGDGMQDQTCRTSPPTLVLALQTGAHLTARRTDASCISLDTVLISPSIEAGPLPGARIAVRVRGRLHRRTDALELVAPRGERMCGESNNGDVADLRIAP